MANNNKNLVDSMVDAQKKMVDTVVENAKKFSNGNDMIKETVEKGSEWYNNWLENQKTIFSKTTEKATEAAESVKDNSGKINEFNQNWFNTQINGAKKMWEMNMNYAKNTNQSAQNTDPMSMWSNAWNNWNGWMNNMQQTNNWNNMMQQWQNKNPMSLDSWQKASSDFAGMFNQYYEMLNNNMTDMQKNMQNGTTQDAYRNMVNVSEGFSRFAEMMMPMWKSIQDKTFNTEMFQQLVKPDMYKEMLDKYFGFMPEQGREYIQNMANTMKDSVGDFSKMGMGSYQQMNGMMNSFMPNSSEMFGNMLNGYNQFNEMMSNAASPFTKMVSPNKHTKMMADWKEIADNMAIYNIKNAELQYMVYNQGAKVMEQLAQNIAEKVEKGEEVTSMLALYQEWMNLSDSTYVALFESEDYSKLMAEVSAMQMKIRKAVDGQVEQMMVNIPVATRSEMDELYKTIYDLKKQVRQLEKMVDIDGGADTAEDKKSEPKAKTTTRRTATKKA